MRSVALPFTEITFDFAGNVAQNAIFLGDVDNDGHFELVVGNAGGELAVFKGGNCPSPSPVAPWRRCTGLGQITAVCVGDLTNEGRNSLVALSADGWCYVFDVVEGGDTSACEEVPDECTDEPQDSTGDEKPVQCAKQPKQGAGEEAKKRKITTTGPNGRGKNAAASLDMSPIMR